MDETLNDVSSGDSGLFSGSIDVGSWSSWMQDVGKSVITTATQAQYNPQLNQAPMRLVAYAPDGTPYIEGQAVKSGGIPPSIAGIPVLWIAAGLALYMVMKD